MNRGSAEVKISTTAIDERAQRMGRDWRAYRLAHPSQRADLEKFTAEVVLSEELPGKCGQNLARTIALVHFALCSIKAEGCVDDDRLADIGLNLAKHGWMVNVDWDFTVGKKANQTGCPGKNRVILKGRYGVKMAEMSGR